ncbi:MAG TPA: response regulator [Myxococcaceae bacterium]|nr:response regulator [Myxococcaceae bacterium]
MKVLIVDDERGARVNVRHPLREHDLTDCLEADGGERAVRVIVEDRPELLFLDVDMPEVDGFEVIRRVGPERMPEVVFLTAWRPSPSQGADLRWCGRSTFTWSSGTTPTETETNAVDGNPSSRFILAAR